MRERIWEIQGTKIGNALGILKAKEEDPDTMHVDENGEYNYKSASRYQHALHKGQ
jgi:hypothetical protein